MKNTNKPYKLDANLELTESELNEITERFGELAQYFDESKYEYARDHQFTDILGLDKFLQNVEYAGEYTQFELSSGRVLFFCFEIGD